MRYRALGVGGGRSQLFLERREGNLDLLRDEGKSCNFALVTIMLGRLSKSVPRIESDACPRGA